MRDCYLVEYDLLEYRKSLELQKEIRAIKEGNRDFDDFLLVLQHNPVFTIGKRGTREDILVPEEGLIKEGIDVVEVKRGGEVTYHGPGQLVGYILLNLTRAKTSVDQFIWKMEEILIMLLKIYEIEGWRKEGYPGVWTDYQKRKWKIAAIGARVSKMITSHGLALNVNTDMDHFRMIVPCGITEYEPISMKQVLNKSLVMKDVYENFENTFEEVFDMKLEKISINKFEEMIKENAKS
ncbi:MAG: lipoyl(octanoyl) transferase LipB [Candidatus Heimdallarchaeota archaeon]|nr:lipoyl(octanoyl) transferase LipB [Candidatus Heimdallarchaeota archaeon]MCK4953983.1 lipoyl(octanoyl) transferase LipB [Candidatus Heimdallarchaeota archaeon]